jgi:hypothetical protein
VGKYVVLIVLIIVAGLILWRWAWVTEQVNQWITPEIKVESQVAGVAVSGVETPLIKATLAEAGFSAPGQITRYQSSGRQAGSVEVDKLHIVLTPHEQAIGKTYGAGESAPYQSWGIEYAQTDGGEASDVTIYLYVRESIVQTEEADKLAKRYQGLLLSAIWDLTHPKRPQDKEFARFEGMSEYKRDKLGQVWWEVQK